VVRPFIPFGFWYFCNITNWTSSPVEYVVVAGGAGGGTDDGGGGGAGGYLTGTTPIGAHPVSTSIQVGAGGAGYRFTNSLEIVEHHHFLDHQSQQLGEVEVAQRFSTLEYTRITRRFWWWWWWWW
jgi:hypothetical protein